MVAEDHELVRPHRGRDPFAASGVDHLEILALVERLVVDERARLLAQWPERLGMGCPRGAVRRAFGCLLCRAPARGSGCSPGTARVPGRFSAFVDVDGMVVVRGRLDPEVGAMLMRAVEAASDALFREEAERGKGELASDHLATIDEPNTELQEVTPEQRRADAVGLIAERALVAGFGGAAGEGPSPAPISGSRAERYQVIVSPLT